VSSEWVVFGSCLLAVACGSGLPGPSPLVCSGSGCGPVDAGPAVALAKPDAQSIALAKPDAQANELARTPCWAADAPACAAEVSEGALCTQSLQTCASQADGAAQLMVCENLSDGIALQWAALHAVTGDCSARVDGCTAQNTADIGARLQDDLSALIDSCIGGESSIQVSFSDGCPVLFTTLFTTPKLPCVNEGLRRYSCLTGPVCGGAALSTLH
jgi:hypothetical protein